MTTSGGGMLVTPDEAMADRVRHLSTQARQPGVHYEHAEVGFNYRLSNVLAALGRVQHRRLRSMIGNRLQVNLRYRELLGEVPGIGFMPVPEWSGWNGWLTCLTFDQPVMARRVREELLAREIESRPLWKPMHEQPAFRDCRNRLDGTSSHLAAHGLCVPSGSALSDIDVEEIASIVRSTVTGLHQRRLHVA
jgi:dTDP-4-amino-4,6-dideoxygalactose transaminase